MDTHAILDHFRRLGTGKKLEILEQLWEEVSSDPTAIQLSDAQRELLDERLRQHEENPRDVSTWDEVKAEALRRLDRDR